MSGPSEQAAMAQEQAELASQSQAVLQQQMSEAASKRIPAQLIADARCVAVFPSVGQAGFIVGVKTGHGLVACRQKTGGFSGAEPAVFTLTGGSVGLQAGAQKGSVVLLFNTEESVDTLFNPEVRFGTQIQATAGPSGYNHVITGAPAPVIGYVTSTEGLFAGINVNGNRLSYDQKANAAAYGPQATAQGILLGQTEKSSELAPYMDTLREFAPTGGDRRNNAGDSQSDSSRQMNSQSQQQSGTGQQSQMSESDQSSSSSSEQMQSSGSEQQSESSQSQ